VGSPPVFLIFLALNLGLYGPGVLLVRETWVRQGRGWGTLVLLGAAYGLLEEGTALSTLFDPAASVVGGLGHYGRAVGVNWLWLIGILGVHIVLSVGLPILLLGLALPQTRGRPLLTRGQTRVALGVFLVDIALLALIVGFWKVELAWLFGAAVGAAGLWAVASRRPAHWLDPTPGRPSLSPGAFFGIGLTYFPIFVLVPGLGREAGLPAPLTGAIDLALALALFLGVRARLGGAENAPHVVLLALGVTLPIALVGLLTQLALPLVLVVDAGYGLFFYALWGRYGPARAATGVPKSPVSPLAS